MATTNLGFDGTVDEAMIAKIFSAGSPPVVADYPDWLVTSVAGERRVSIAAGTAFASFIRTDRDAPDLLDLVTPAAGRLYLVVARRDWTLNETTFLALPGPATSTAVPTTSNVMSVDPASAEGFRDDPGLVQDQPLSWAWCRATDNFVRTWDLRRWLEDGPNLTPGDITLGYLKCDDVTVRRVTDSATPRRLGWLDITVDRPTKIRIDFHGQWESEANAAGWLYLRSYRPTDQATNINGGNYYSHNLARRNWPRYFSYGLNFVIPAGTTRIDAAATTDQASGAHRLFQYCYLVISEA